MKIVFAVLLVTLSLATGSFTQPCPPTTLPFIDNFDSPELDSCWTWIREDTSHWSLTERPGWMRIQTYGHLYGNTNSARNVILREFSDEDFVVETKVETQLAGDNGAGLLIYQDDANFLDLWANSNAGYINSTREVNEDYAQQSRIWVNWNPAYLRCTKIGYHYFLDASPDNINWSAVAYWQLQFEGIRVGLISSGPYDDQLIADFDYFRVDPLAGTSVCGNVSGVWDSTGSPYYVTCDVTVPAGQTLEIQPGVEVLFTGHYKFNVFGNLQAIGTEEDSIIFTRAFPTEESKWAGIHIESSQLTNQIAYARIEESADRGITCLNSTLALSNTAVKKSYGGMQSINSHTDVSNCEFFENNSQLHPLSSDGGGADWRNCTGLIENVAFRDNVGQHGGGFFVGFSPSPQFDHCLVIGNAAYSSSGAYFNEGANVQIRNCTFAENSPTWEGMIHVWNSSLTVNSSIFYSPTSPPITTDGANVGLTYTNISGGYAGTGNINVDPMFVDAQNGNFQLLLGSPCIDAGDPAYPLDPDGSRTDMGAFPFSDNGPRLRVASPVGGENWMLLDSAVVEWVGTGFDGAVMIELNRDFPSGEWDTLAFNTPNDSVETVFVEEPISNNCRVRVSSLETSLSGVSNANFSIVPSSGYLAMVRPAQPNTALFSWNAGTMECPNAIQETFRLKNFGNASINVFRPEETPSAEFSRVTACPSSFTLLPGQVSACDLTLSFTPESDGSYLDSMRIRTNASNGQNGAVWIPLTGNQVTTPAPPEVTISVQGDDALLRWPSVIESVGECPITATGYLVFYSPTQTGPFYYHGFTTDTSYTHTRVVHYNYGMFYHVVAVQAESGLLAVLPVNGDDQMISETELMKRAYMALKQ